MDVEPEPIDPPELLEPLELDPPELPPELDPLEDPPSPPRGADEPVVLPLDVRSCAAAGDIPLRAKARANELMYARFIFVLLSFGPSIFDPSLCEIRLDLERPP